MKALVTGITGLRNRGVEAIVAPTIKQLSQRLSNLHINILTKTPDYDAIRLQKYHVDPINDDISTSSGGRLRQLYAKLPLSKSSVSQESLAQRSLRDASIVIASGGDIFSSDYGKGLYRHLRPLEIALEIGVPVVFLAQSIGPFKTDEATEAWIKVAKRSKLITVREKISYDYVTNKLGLSTDLVKQTADPAFLLDPSPLLQVQNLLKSYGIVEGAPLIGFSISQGISRYSECDARQHLKVLHKVVQKILNELKAQILLVPHVQDVKASNDDRMLATQLLESLEFDPRVHLAGADHSASEFKGLLGACDLVIAERMHAAIAGLSSGVCTVAVGYSIKAEGILSDLLGAESTHNGLLIPIQQFLDADQAWLSIQDSWKRRQEVESQLKQVLPRVKHNSASNFDMISKLFE